MQFSEIKGQEQAIHILHRAIETRHIANAVLFLPTPSGPVNRYAWAICRVSIARCNM